jgi:hypothetical protein
MRRLFYSLGIAALAVAFVPTPAHAQQQFSFYIGDFSPRGLDSRDIDDVLLNDTAFLDYDFQRFSNVTVGGEWLVDLGNHAEAGAGIGFYKHTEPAFDCCSASPVGADLALRIVPIDATVRLLPLGHGPVEPYVGAGVGILAWRYSEVGNFVATDGVTVINGRFVGSGTSVGPVILGGVRFPIGQFALGGEIRYQSAVANLPTDQGFASSSPTSQPKIDLGGFNYLVTFNVRF